MATQPAYRAYTVIKREGADDFWLAIGAAFPHTSGDGFNIVLQALPLPDKDGQCKLVLRPPKADDDESREAGNVQSLRMQGRTDTRRQK